MDATVARRVAAAVDQLPETYREVVRMLYYEELPVRVIADRLGIPEGTTKTRLRAARQRLAAELAAAGWAGA
jgi:RNA polymerase sigma-70 factor (ECF subfamily)